MDASYQVGTDAFDLASVGEIDSVDDLLIDNCARFLLKDWEGVGELVDGTETAVAYTPERGVALLKQNPSLYWLILAEAANIAQGKEQQTQETVKSHRGPKVAKGIRRRAGRESKVAQGETKSPAHSGA